MLKENECINLVMYPNANPNPNKPRQPTESSQQGIPMSMDQIESERKSLEQDITGKLENIEKIIQEKLAGGLGDSDRLKNRVDLLADQLEIAMRKFEKERGRVVDVSMQLKKMDERRMDDKLIENLVVMIKRQGQEIEEGLDKKLSKDVWDKEHPRFVERVQIVSESLAEKADKHEIKRAFQFVEDKIKEIVVLLAGDIQQEKEGAGRRLPFKCLSCDKELDTSKPSTQRCSPIARGLQSRCSSSNLRRRVRGGPM